MWYRQMAPAQALDALAARCMELSEDVETGRTPRAILEYWLAEWAAAVQRAAGAQADDPAPSGPPPVATPSYTLPAPGSGSSSRKPV